MNIFKYLILISIGSMLFICVYYIDYLNSNSKLELNKIEKNISDNQIEIKTKKLEDMKKLKAIESDDVKLDYKKYVEKFNEEITIEKSNELYVIPNISITKYVDKEDEITITKNQEIEVSKYKNISITIVKDDNTKSSNDNKSLDKETNYINKNITNQKQELNDLYAILKNDSSKSELDLSPKYQEELNLKKLAQN